MIYTLWICHTFTWGVCNAYVHYDYPTQDDCFKAAKFYLETAKKKPESMVCAPAQKGDK
jgi:hypothetical protein